MRWCGRAVSGALQRHVAGRAQQRVVRGGGTPRLLLEHHAGSTERVRPRPRLRHDKVCAPEQLAEEAAQLAAGPYRAC